MSKDKQLLFVHEYLKDWNATQAAIRAGYSEKTAKSQGNRLLTLVDVKKAIADAQKQFASKAKKTAAEVFEEMVDVTNEARQEGDLKTTLKGLELQGKYLGMFTDRVVSEISGGLQIGWESK